MTTEWGWETAQVCMNGHVITGMLRSSSEKASKFCVKCGERTITNCVSCSVEIRGYRHVPGQYGGPGYTLPSFCHDCGQPYPWTSARLSAAQALAAEAIGLSLEERETLAKTLPDLIRDTPKTPLAATRFKLLVAKAGPDV